MMQYLRLTKVIECVSEVNLKASTTKRIQMQQLMLAIKFFLTRSFLTISNILPPTSLIFRFQYATKGKVKIESTKNLQEFLVWIYLPIQDISQQGTSAVQTTLSSSSIQAKLGETQIWDSSFSMRESFNEGIARCFGDIFENL